MPTKVTGKCGSVTVRLIPAPRGAGIVAARVPKKVLQMILARLPPVADVRLATSYLVQLAAGCLQYCTRADCGVLQDQSARAA